MKKIEQFVEAIILASLAYGFWIDPKDVLVEGIEKVTAADIQFANELGYLEGNIVKYVSRWKDKGGVDDLKKAQHYLTKLIETQEK